MVGLMQALLLGSCLMLGARSQGAPISSVYHQNVTVFSANALVRQHRAKRLPQIASLHHLCCKLMFTTRFQPA